MDTLFYLKLFILMTLVETVRSEHVYVQTNDGRIMGTTVTSFENRTVDTYLGIPFAEPPVGNLRFELPQPKKPWSDVWNATKLPNACMQPIFPNISFLTENVTKYFELRAPMKEDCLFLNIWNPNTGDERKPVLFWIYGGGFVYGSIDLIVYDGLLLSAYTGLIVVTVNYRLGSLGFLHQKPNFGPNMGLEDQRLALQWIHDNIVYFGGDPDRVTIIGESAGGVSVTSLMTESKAKGLYSRAVSMSGTAGTIWTQNYGIGRNMQRNTMENNLIVEYAESLNCQITNDSTTSDALACLKALPAEDLIITSESSGRFNTFPAVNRNILDFKEFSESVKSSLNDIPLMVGLTKDEGSVFLTIMMKCGARATENNLTIEEAAKCIRESPIFAPYPSKSLDIIVNHYLNSSDDVNILEELINVVGDSFLSCPAIFFSHLADEAGLNLFFYEFSHTPEKDFYPKWMGAMHTVDIGYLFALYLSDSDQANVEMSRQFMDNIKAFAESGDPSISTSQWPSWKSPGKPYKNFNRRSTDKDIGYGLKESTCAVWNRLINQLI
ncbi:pnbA (predicted) [Pycnogonum litorale]